VGCNVGAWLADCRRRWPRARLAGVEPNAKSLAYARELVPDADLREASAAALPFSEGTFDYVTCFEVLEHVPEPLRAQALRELYRVLKPGGTAVLSVPHRGWFAWLDSNNVRFRLPALYGLVVRRGLRDDSYARRGESVEWHHHFTREELLSLAGEGWRTVAIRSGGLFLTPLVDWLSWPFYRTGQVNHPLRRLLGRLAAWDDDHDYGRASYGVLFVLQKVTQAQQVSAAHA
jgi:SAM-dependent methyltransferase